MSWTFKEKALSFVFYEAKVLLLDLSDGSADDLNVGFCEMMMFALRRHSCWAAGACGIVLSVLRKCQIPTFVSCCVGFWKVVFLPLLPNIGFLEG